MTDRDAGQQRPSETLMAKKASAKTFGERLRALRTQRGISQEKLCQMIKAHRNFVGYVERGQENVCLDNILKLARALKVKPAELFDLYE